MAKRVSKPAGRQIILGVISLFLGLLAVPLGFIGFGSVMVGVPAIIIGSYLIARGVSTSVKILGGLGVFFACLGIVTTIEAMIALEALKALLPQTLEEAEKAVEEVLTRNISRRIGESVIVNNFSITVNSIRVSDKYVYKFDKKYETALSKPDSRFVIIELTVKNTGLKSESPDFWETSFQIVTDKGYIYTTTDLYEFVRERREATTEEINTFYCEEIYLTKRLLPREETKGCLIFGIPADMRPIKLEFEYGFFPKHKVSISLT